MGKKSFFRVCAGIVMGLMFASCQHDRPEGKYRDYGSLQFIKDAPYTILLESQDEVNTISSCKVGDSITVFMQVGYTGAYIYYVDYVWELTIGDVVEKTIVGVVDPVNLPSPPMLTFKAPDAPGNYLMRFKANYKFSADTAIGTIYGESKTSSATLRVQ